MLPKAQTVKVEGLRELVQALNVLPDRLAKNGLRVAVYAAAKVVRDEARQRAPVAAQALGLGQPPAGTLKRSVIMKHISELSSRTRQTFFVMVRHGKKYRRQGKKGQLSQDAWYWRFVEFGTRKMSARPFLRPSLETKRHEAVDAMRQRLANRLEEEAKKLHRP